MNISNGSRPEARQSEDSIRLEIKGIGHCPAFKNSKMLTRGRLITNPKKQKWMQKAIQLLESQLRSFVQTKDAGTSMVQPAPHLIALLPQDDSCEWIQELKINYVRVQKGEEGVLIRIEKIP